MPFLDVPTSHIDPQDTVKIRVARALAELLSDSAYEKITISQICKTAGIAKQTFYNHFSSKYDVATWFWLHAAQRFLFRVGVDLTWSESISKNLAYVDPFTEFFQIIFKGEHTDSGRRFAFGKRVESLTETVEMRLRAPLSNSLRFQIIFFADGESRLLTIREYGSLLKDRATYAKCLEACVPTELRNLLDSAVLKERASSSSF